MIHFEIVNFIITDQRKLDLISNQQQTMYSVKLYKYYMYKWIGFQLKKYKNHKFWNIFFHILAKNFITKNK